MHCIYIKSDSIVYVKSHEYACTYILHSILVLRAVSLVSWLEVSIVLPLSAQFVVL